MSDFKTTAQHLIDNGQEFSKQLGRMMLEMATKQDAMEREGTFHLAIIRALTERTNRSTELLREATGRIQLLQEIVNLQRDVISEATADANRWNYFREMLPGIVLKHDTTTGNTSLIKLDEPLFDNFDPAQLDALIDLELANEEDQTPCEGCDCHLATQ